MEIPPASLNTLPPELKALIVLMVDRLDQHISEFGDEDDEDDSSDDSGSDDEPSSHRSVWRGSKAVENEEEREMAEDSSMDEREGGSTMAALSETCREFAELAFPFLWGHVDFAHLDNDAVEYFLTAILPRHGQFTRSIWFRTSLEENERPAPPAFVQAPLDAPHPVLRIETDDIRIVDDVFLAEAAYKAQETVEWGEKRRRKLFAEILAGLPRLEGVDMDLVRGANSVARTTRVALALVQNHPKQIIDLSLCSPEGTLLSGAWLAQTFFPHFAPTLLRLELAGVDGGLGMLESLASFTTLESLTLSDCAFLNDELPTIRDWSFAPTLKILALEACANLDLPTFCDFVEVFGGTLEVLDLEDCPSADSDPDNLAFLDRRPFALPHLHTLAISTFHTLAFLRSFSKCPLETIELGFNPVILYPELEEFLGSLPKLKEVIVGEESNLTSGQRESLELWAFARGVECTVEEGSEDSEEEDPFTDTDEDDDSAEEGDEEMETAEDVEEDSDEGL